MIYTFKDLLISRSNPFEINLELEIRKLFERNTDYRYEIRKNDDKFGYDLQIYRYFINGGDWVRKDIAYIELEVSEKWVDEYPKYWKDYSFLARKVYKYENGSFINELKQNAEKTIYVIFNKNITDCICRDIKTISTFETKSRGVMNNTYHDTYLTINYQNSKIIRGIDNMLGYCNSYFNEICESISN